MTLKKRGGLRGARAVLGSACLALAITGCAGAPPEDDPVAVALYREANDPIEPLNRSLFQVNLVLDKAILKPLAFGYSQAVPDPLQTMIGNFLRNLRAPVIFANDLLQGEAGRAGNTLIRFAMNSGVGILGTVDVAEAFGVPRHDEDFGQTAAVWGVGEGFYLMLPLLGPSNLRDAASKAVDFLFDPFTYLSHRTFNYARFGTGIVHVRARRYDEINRLERTSLDYYVAVRSLYRQKRADEIRNRRLGPLQPMSTISPDPEGERPAGSSRRSDHGSMP